MKNAVLNVNVSAIQLLVNATNGSAVIANGSLPSSIAAVSLIFAGFQPISISGKLSMFLPDFIVTVNLSTNYTRVRVILQATSPSLSFVAGEDSYIDVGPKCAMGNYVASSGASYDCFKCPNGTFSNQVDSRACRLAHKVLLFHICVCSV